MLIQTVQGLDETDLEWIRTEAPEVYRRLKVSTTLWNSLSDCLEIELSGSQENQRLSHLDVASVYVAGSMARWEANEDSDLDVMILHEASGTTPLTLVQQAHTLALVDEIRDQTGFRPFSRGGHFVQFHSVDRMTKGIGGEDDNSTNQFTARMMLLLNGVPLINQAFHDKAFNQVLDSYWRQVSEPNTPFLPIYLLNDIRRWWLELCLNFEKHNPPIAPTFNSQSQTSDAQASRRLANLKLRFSRVLGPFSALMCILFEASDLGVTKALCANILKATPIERLMHIRRNASGTLRESVEALIRDYDKYLSMIRAPKIELLEKVKSPSWVEIKKSAYSFGDSIHLLLMECGAQKPISRYLLV